MEDFVLKIVRQEKILIRTENATGRDDKGVKGGKEKKTGKKRKARKWKPICTDYDIPF